VFNAEEGLRASLEVPRAEPKDWGRFFAVMLWNTSGRAQALQSFLFTLISL
jgi:hypothetical protein